VPRWNNLPLIFLHLGVAPTGGVGGQVAWSSRRSLDLVRFVSGGWRSALSRVTVALAATFMCGVLQLGVRMTAGGDIRLSSTESGEDGGVGMW
jgi:preprotein translocase subunit SecG